VNRGLHPTNRIHGPSKHCKERDTGVAVCHLCDTEALGPHGREEVKPLGETGLNGAGHWVETPVTRVPVPRPKWQGSASSGNALLEAAQFWGEHCPFLLLLVSKRYLNQNLPALAYPVSLKLGDNWVINALKPI
jgi:hypothetical protein